MHNFATAPMTTLIKKKRIKRKSATLAHKPLKKYKREEPLTYEKVLKLFQDTDKKFQDTDKKIHETSEQIKETDRTLNEKFSATDKKFQDTDKKMKELQGLFTTQCGKLVEALLGKGCLSLFIQRGIKVNQTAANIQSRREGKTMEVDVLLVNDTEAVVIEVKTTARVQHVKELIEDLKEFKTFFSQYKSYKIYGGLAALKFEEESHKYATSQGLFVIESTGEGLVQIQNKKEFTPKGF